MAVSQEKKRKNHGNVSWNAATEMFFFQQSLSSNVETVALTRALLKM